MRMSCESRFNGRCALRMHKQVRAWEEKAGQSWLWPILKVGSSSPRDRIPCLEPSHPKAWRVEKSRVVAGVQLDGADEPERSLVQHPLPVASRTGAWRMRTQPEADDSHICQVPVWTSYVGSGNPTIPSILNCRIATLLNPPLSDTRPSIPALCQRHQHSAYRQSRMLLAPCS